MKRGILLVHGVGEHNKGQFLESFLEPMLDFLRAHFRDDLRVQVDQRPENGSSRASLAFSDEQWELREVWWTQAFYPQLPYAVVWWAFRSMVLNLGSIVIGILVGIGVPPSRLRWRAGKATKEVQLTQKHVKAPEDKPQKEESSVRESLEDSLVYGSQALHPISRAYDFLFGTTVLIG